MYGVLVAIADDRGQTQEVVIGFQTRDDFFEADLSKVSTKVRRHLRIQAAEEIEIIEEFGEIGNPDIRYI